MQGHVSDLEHIESSSSRENKVRLSRVHTSAKSGAKPHFHVAMSPERPGRATVASGAMLATSALPAAERAARRLKRLSFSASDR